MIQFRELMYHNLFGQLRFEREDLESWLGEYLLNEQPKDELKLITTKQGG